MQIIKLIFRFLWFFLPHENNFFFTINFFFNFLNHPFREQRLKEGFGFSFVNTCKHVAQLYGWLLCLCHLMMFGSYFVHWFTLSMTCSHHHYHQWNLLVSIQGQRYELYFSHPFVRLFIAAFYHVTLTTSFSKSLSLPPPSLYLVLAKFIFFIGLLSVF